MIYACLRGLKFHAWNIVVRSLVFALTNEAIKKQSEITEVGDVSE